MPRGWTRRQALRALGATAAGTASITLTQPAAATGRLNVGVSTTAGRKAAKRHAADVYRILDFDDYGTVISGWYGETARTALEEREDVDFVEPDHVVRAIDHTTESGDPENEQVGPWGIDRVDADVSHHEGATGDGGTVAILDSGIDPDHEDLAVAGGRAFVECNDEYGNCSATWADDNDHGTHCAGIAAARDNDIGVVGAGPALDLYAVKVLDWRGAGFTSDVAAGLEWTADHERGIDVASMSLGGLVQSSTLERACRYAYDEGVLLIAAAGNDGPLAGTVGYPAAYEEVIAVSATTSDDDIASFSSRGDAIELAAPGAEILSTVRENEYDVFSGTSMACPHVSAVGAQLLAEGYSNAADRDNHGDPGGARGRLRDTAEDIGLSPSEQGYGLLNAPLAANVVLEVTSGGTRNVDERRATLVGYLVANDGEILACYFEWRRRGAEDWRTSEVETLESPGRFETTVTGLEPESEYQYRAVGDVDGERRDTGRLRRFETAGGSLLPI